MMNESGRQPSIQIHLLRTYLIVLAAFALLAVGFYFLAGDQLLYRESRGDLPLPQADSWTAELTGGVTVEQRFRTKIHRLERVSAQFATSFRQNSGAVTMELLRETDGALLCAAQFDAGEITESQVLTMYTDRPLEGLYLEPLLLRITADSAPGSAVAALCASQAQAEGFALTVNGEPVPGMLCFSAGGTDIVWTGLHFWKICAAFALLISLVFLTVHLRAKKGKRSYLLNAAAAIGKYRFLIRQLVSRDFKTKYKRSVLGVFWSFLNPLLMMLVQYFVFSTLFRSDIANFAAYLIIGTVMFNFFSESCSMTLGSILGNAGLITKVYMPKYIYPLTRTMSSVVNLLISLIPLALVCLITGVRIQPATVLSLFFFVCLVIFCLGLGMLLSTSMVFFRDTQFLWGVASLMWMYATPIFYPESIVPDKLRFVFALNPLYHFLSNARICILNGISPEPTAYIRCMLIALGMLLVGAAVFYKNQDKFVLYL